MKNEWASFLLALQFLTRIPVGSKDLYSETRMAASVCYYPLVGVVIGVVTALCFYVATYGFSLMISVLIATAAGLLLTGAFHEDGLADTFDGVGGGLTRENTLDIMKDSRLGTYGTLALVTALALKVGALVALPSATIPIALIGGHCLSRLSSLYVIATSQYIRDNGTGKPVAGGASKASLGVATATGIVVIMACCMNMDPRIFMFGVGGLIVGHVLMRLFFEPKLGGYTGDTLGAVQQSSEIGFYLGIVAWL